MMKIFVACIFLPVVTCTRGQIKTYIDDYSRLFGVESDRRWLRSAARGAGNEITGAFYLPARKGDNQSGRGGGGGNNYFKDLGAGAGSLSNEIGNEAADSNYFQGWGTDADGNSNQGGSGGADVSNFQGWTPIGSGVSNQGGGFNLPIGSAGEGSYKPPPSVSEGAGRVSNQGGNGGVSTGKLQDWTAGASSVSNQGSSRGGSSSNFQAFTAFSASNQGGSRGVGDSSFQDYSANADSVSNQDGNGDAGAGNFQGWGNGPGSVSNQGGSGGGGSRLPGPIGNAGGDSFQGYSANAGSASNQGGNGGAFGIGGAGGTNFQRWDTGTGGISNQVGSGRGGRGLPGPTGNAAGCQGYSRGLVSSYKRGGSRCAGGSGGFSNQGGSGLGEYQNVPIGSQTSEGRNIDLQLLEQVRFILLQEEASSGLDGEESPFLSSSFSAPLSSYGAPSTSFGAPSSAYGAPSVGAYGRDKSGRVDGIVFERIDQSIQIAEIHQTTSELIPSGDGSPWITSPISSHSYGSPQ